MIASSGNRLLATLSTEACQLLLKHALQVNLPVKKALFEAEETPRNAFFITSGLACVVASMPNGETIEAGIIGSEGIVGGTQLLGPAKFSTAAFMQISGTGIRIGYADLRRVFNCSNEIRARILEFEQSQYLAATQISGCNRLHDAQPRLARWLLMSHDRIESDELTLTQEFLGLMLGTRRPTVTVAAIDLQRRGLIEYSRGRIKILNRAKLENAACGCYRINQRLLNELYAKDVSAG